MLEIFGQAPGVDCRACGAVFAAPPSDPSLGLCGTCENEFRYVAANPRMAHSLDKWLAHRLILDLKRAKRGDMLGRCEAISRQGAHYSGYQCGHKAQGLREGRKACAVHMKYSEPAWVDQRDDVDAYRVLAELMAHVAKQDANIARVICGVASELTDT